MRYAIASGNLQDILLEYNIYEKTDTNIMLIDDRDYGRIQIKNQQTKGVKLIEWEAIFSKPTRVYEDMDNGGSHFSLYYNLGNNVRGKFFDKELQISARSQNIWSFSGTESGYIDYRQGEKDHSFSIVLEESYLQDLANRYPDLLMELYIGHSNNSFQQWNKCDIPINHEVNQILSQINNADVMGKYSSVYIEAKILELLVLQLRCPDMQNCSAGKFCKNKSDIAKMHEARSILLQNIGNPTSICELSKKVGVNNNKLKNGFKEVFKQTIYGCLFEYKMERAYKLLLETDKTISEIGYECGYDYASHFTTAFKRRFGVSPKEFRRI